MLHSEQSGDASTGCIPLHRSASLPTREPSQYLAPWSGSGLPPPQPPSFSASSSWHQPAPTRRDQGAWGAAPSNTMHGPVLSQSRTLSYRTLPRTGCEHLRSTRRCSPRLKRLSRSGWHSQAFQRGPPHASDYGKMKDAHHLVEIARERGHEVNCALTLEIFGASPKRHPALPRVRGKPRSLG